MINNTISHKISATSIGITCNEDDGIDGCTIEAKEVDGDSEAKCSASINDSCTLKNLKSETNYSVTVRLFRNDDTRTIIFGDQSDPVYIFTGCYYYMVDLSRNFRKIIPSGGSSTRNIHTPSHSNNFRFSLPLPKTNSMLTEYV